MSSGTPLIIYTHPDCPYSAAALEELKSQDISYQQVDVSKAPAAIQELERLTGGDHITPVIVEGDRVTVGYMGVG